MAAPNHATAGPRTVQVNGRAYRYCPATWRLQIRVHGGWWLANVCAPSYADIEAAKDALAS